MKKVWLCGYSHRTKVGKKYVWSPNRYNTLAEAMQALAVCYEKNRLNEELHHPEFRYDLIEDLKPEE